MSTENPQQRAASTAGESGPTIKWDDSNLRSVYCNFVNASGTREEITLLLGTHQAWRGGMKEVTVQLQERVILNPFAAKRLHMLLGQILREYEARYGGLNVEGMGTPAISESLPTRSTT
jgi:hypothetical protein